MCVIKLFLVSLLFIVTIQLSSCKCKHSFVTLCDNFKDLKDIWDKQSVTELMIGSENSTANETVNLMHQLHFSAYPRLTSLYVINKVQNLGIQYAFECTYYTTKLNVVIFYGNNFTFIEEYHFPVVTARKFTLAHNKIETIKRGSFDNHQIEIFDVSDNFLEVIEAESLPKAAKTIIVKNNKLNFIEPGSFPSTLESLILDYNNLRHLSDEVIGHLTNLSELTLSNNKFKEIPNIAHMKKLVVFDISSNGITAVQSSIFKAMDNLKVLDLSNNYITAINTFSSLVGSEKRPSLMISLAFNRLRALDLTNVTFRKEKLILYGNPWDCQTWDTMLKQLIQHQDECDLKFFSSGSTPYCLNFKSEFMNFDHDWLPHILRLQNTIKTSNNKPNCILSLHKYVVLGGIGFGCVA